MMVDSIGSIHQWHGRCRFVMSMSDLFSYCCLFIIVVVIRGRELDGSKFALIGKRNTVTRKETNRHECQRRI